MSTKFESSVREIPYAQERVYAVLSDLNNLERIKDKIPADKEFGISFNSNQLTIHANMVGDICFEIVEREEYKTIKFASVKSPIPINIWIQLLPITANSCKMKLTLKAELNPFIKGMVQKPLQEAIEKIATLLQHINYEA